MKRGLAALAAVALTGCQATVNYAPEGGSAGDGIRYYENSPYVVAYSNGQGGLNWQLMYLPDQTRLMVAKPSIIGGRTEMTLYFHNGVLAGSSAVGDSTALPKAVIAAVQSAIPILSKTLAKPPPHEFPPPYIFKVVVKGDDVSLVSAQGDIGVKVIQEPKS